MKDCIEQRQVRMPMNKLKWNVDGTKGKSRSLDFHKIAKRAEFVRANPPIKPLSCTVWRDEGI